MSDLTYSPPAVSFDETPATPELISEPILAPRWSPLTRLAFRFAFAYFSTYALCCGNATIWEVVPFHVGEFCETWFAWPFSHGAQWFGLHILHLTGVGAHLHGTGSGDTVLDWLAAGLMLALALLITIIWTAISELRPAQPKSQSYPRLLFWFSLLLRLTLGYAMLTYGMVKVFPLQMGPPMLATLNSPLGNSSPMSMLWTLIGLNPVYETICGLAECAGGILILFRRTTLLGTLLIAFLTTNIALYNFCFDVPVKLYALHLIFMSLVLLAPSLGLLFNFFYLHKPSFPRERWSSPVRWNFLNLGIGIRIETLVTAIMLILTLAIGGSDLGSGYFGQRRAMAHPSPFMGQWHLTSATLNNVPTPYLTGDGLPMSDIFLEPSGRANVRDTAAVLWRAGFDVDEKKHTVTLGSTGHKDTAGHGGSVTYALNQPDPSHILLVPTDKAAKTNPTLALTRVPLPAHYPLLDRGFHFINEWGLER